MIKAAAMIAICVGILNLAVFPKLFENMLRQYGAKEEDMKMGSLILQVTGFIFLAAGCIFLFQ